MALGGLFLVLLLAFAVVLGYSSYMGPRLDASSKAYVDEKVPAILQAWSSQTLWEEAAPELKRSLGEEQLAALFARFSQALGGLRDYDGSSGEANLALLIDKGKVITARYTVQARFAKGPAAINVGLIEHDGRWQIIAFHVNSPLLVR